MRPACAAAAALAAFSVCVARHVRAAPSPPAATALTDALGPAVAASLASTQLDSTGWSWNWSSAYQTDRRGGNASAADWARSSLNLHQARFSANPGNLIFAPDPAGAGRDQPVWSVTCAAGSYGQHARPSPSGGTALYAQPFLNATGGVSGSDTPYVLASQTAGQANASSASRAQLLLAYSVYFPAEFDFVRGGRLPGLYSSVASHLSSTGAVEAGTDACQGGSLDGLGSSCWSAHIMWRQGGQGEVRMYAPPTLGGGYRLCPPATATATGASLLCNPDFGLSVGRGSFLFRRGSWTDLSLYVQLNMPGIANGRIQLFVNRAATPAIRLDGLVFRSEVLNHSGVGPGNGVYSSAINGKPPTSGLNRRDSVGAADQTWVDKVAWLTYFDGTSSAYAPPNDTQTYFKNIAFFAGNNFSSQPGRSFTLNPAARRPSPVAPAAVSWALATLLALLF